MPGHTATLIGHPDTNLEVPSTAILDIALETHRIASLDYLWEANQTVTGLWLK
jgi:hypothetical protein